MSGLCICMYACGGHRSASGVFFNCSPTLISYLTIYLFSLCVYYDGCVKYNSQEMFFSFPHVDTRNQTSCQAWRKDLCMLNHLDGSLPYLFMFNVYSCFARLYVCAPCAYLPPVEARRRHQVPWNWSYRWQETVVWGLGTKPSQGPLEDQPVHSITKPSLQPLYLMSLSLSSCWGDGQPLSPRGSPISNGIIDQCWFGGIQTQGLYPLCHLPHQWPGFETTKM